MKSAKPIPLEENDYVSSEKFSIKIDDDQNDVEIWDKKNDRKKRGKNEKKDLTEKKKYSKEISHDLVENINFNEFDIQSTEKNQVDNDVVINKIKINVRS